MRNTREPDTFDALEHNPGQARWELEYELFLREQEQFNPLSLEERAYPILRRERTQ